MAVATKTKKTEAKPSKNLDLPAKSKKHVTKIVIKYDVGFSNQLYIRGHGANLSWEKGILLQNIRPDEWIWETELPLEKGEFKVLINDKHYEQGENHHIQGGAHLQYTPRF